MAYNNDNADKDFISLILLALIAVLAILFGVIWFSGRFISGH